jgi:hypothetical protein
MMVTVYLAESGHSKHLRMFDGVDFDRLEDAVAAIKKQLPKAVFTRTHESVIVAVNGRTWGEIVPASDLDDEYDYDDDTEDSYDEDTYDSEECDDTTEESCDDEDSD